jgi:hypothetical protein
MSMLYSSKSQQNNPFICYFFVTRQAKAKTAGFIPPSEVSFNPSTASGPPSIKRDGKKRLPLKGELAKS